MAKAAVFPVPVWAHPNKSLPLNKIGMDCCCIGVGSVYPLACNAFRIGATIPSWSNVIYDKWSAAKKVSGRSIHLRKKQNRREQGKENGSLSDKLPVFSTNIPPDCWFIRIGAKSFRCKALRSLSERGDISPGRISSESNGSRRRS